MISPSDTPARGGTTDSMPWKMSFDTSSSTSYCRRAYRGIHVRDGVRADERPATILRPRKHGVAGHCFFRRHFFLQDVPMFNDKIALESKNVCGNKRLAPAA